MSATVTGRRERRANGDAIAFDRTVGVGAGAVWAAITEPAVLQQWIGTWSGDPATGTVQFRMTAEGDDVPAERVTIEECARRERLRLSIRNPAGDADPDAGGAAADDWRLELEIAEHDDATTLTFAQLVADPTGIGDIAPGWEYYLDRLVAVLTGGDVAAVDFADYHPAQSEHYRALFV